MSEARFLQIHTPHSYSSVLLNRDDTGLAKRLPYGGAMRTRISSQCLKRHWRIAEDPHALAHISGATEAFRSRELVTRKVIAPLTGKFSEATLLVLDNLFQTKVYGDSGTEKSKRQTLLFGKPELDWLAAQAVALAPKLEPLVSGASAPATEVKDDKARKKQADDRLRAALKAAELVITPWANTYNASIKVMRDQTALPGGLAAALFGRMVTSDTAANIDAPIHVAHAFTVHAEESESDYLTAMDDLKQDTDDSGADTIQETELTSGIFYGYVVVDVPGLITNTTGCDRAEWLNADRALAAEVVHNLLYLIAEVSPGAKLGSTAPYGRAELMLVEAGNRQPRSLSPAFRLPVPPRINEAISSLGHHLAKMDAIYATGEARRVLHIANEELIAAPRETLPNIAAWTKAAVLHGSAA